jgi:NAD(P) transhydrogenase subunit alpha
MIIGVPKETYPGEKRVALVPDTLPSLISKGASVLVERDAGRMAGFPDDSYRDKGAKIVLSRADVFARSDAVLQVRSLGANPERGGADLEMMRPGMVVAGQCDPLRALEQVSEQARRGVTLFALELMPRIPRAQSMDVLSSMATIAGYKAVLMAAGELPKMFPLLMTAAGTAAPARLLVIGAGVAGLQAIATARRLGAVVEAYDVRPAAREQVESLGARFVDLGLESDDSEGAGGYAVEMDDDFYRRQQKALGKVVGESDVVITTAAVPGARAPVLVGKEMVSGMAPGSVVVDLAAEYGGNCELTRPGETVVDSGVRILGAVNLPATVPHHASQMYAHNMSTFLGHMLEDGRLRMDMEDEITAGTLVAREGRIVHPQVRERMESTEA